MKTKIKGGFTLIELLVVIAIIALLASVVLAGITPQKAKSRTAAAFSQMASVRKIAVACDYGIGSTGGSLLTPASMTLGGGNVCSSDSRLGNWPPLPTGGSPAWTYGTPTDATAGDGVFSFTATGDGYTITCNQNSCVKS